MATTIHKFDNAAYRAVADAAEAALKSVAERFGLTVEKRASCSSDLTFTASFEFKATAQDGTFYGLEKVDIVRSFTEVILELEALARRLRELSASTISDDALYRELRDESEKLQSILIRWEEANSGNRN